MGEGAAVLVLETESHARARGAVILAELAGYAATADAFHVTAPDENGAGGAAAIRLALAAAGANPEEVGYINAHGTATPLNDVAETRAIKAAFGAQAYKIPVSSTKSMTGHMMSATGALEAIFCVQAVREGILPPPFITRPLTRNVTWITSPTWRAKRTSNWRLVQRVWVWRPQRRAGDTQIPLMRL